MMASSFLPGLAVGTLFGWALNWWLHRTSQKDESVIALDMKPTLKGQVPTPEEELRMALVVNDSLKMGKGKIGAQCAHAAVGLVEKLKEDPVNDVLLRQWDDGGHVKVCVKAVDEQQLAALTEAAREAGLLSYQVADFGRTQIPAGSHTVLAIGPALKSQLDKITGQLKLL